MGARCSSWVCFIPATRPRQACPQQHAAEKHLFHHRRFPSLGKQRTTARQLHCLRTSVGPPLTEAAHDAGVQLRQVEARQQAPDHPIVWGIPETSYLKFLIFQVV